MMAIGRRFGLVLSLLAILVSSVWCAEEVPARLPKVSEDYLERATAAGLEVKATWVTMRDGTRLASTVTKPFFGEPFPTILVRTPYNRDDLDAAAMLLSLAGYAVVAQDMRGRFDSEGVDRVFLDDGWGANQDGYDTVEWIADRSWSDGKIGTWGPSALGIVQGLMAGAVPPHLTCQAISYAASKGYGQATYQGGALRRSLVDGWLEGQKSLHMLPEFVGHPTEDAFWSQYDIVSKHPQMTAPALFIGGFYDCFLQGTIDDFVGRQTNGGPGARGNCRMILGPWTHVNEASTEIGELEYPSDSTMSYLDQVDLVMEWFDYWLKGDDNDAMDGDPVKYYLMGAAKESGAPGNDWTRTPVWPPESQTAELYLHTDGTLDATRGADDESAVTLNFDPSDPIPTRGGANLEIDAGPYDQRTLESRSDLASFTTAALTKPLSVVGRIRAVIYASSNLTDMDVTVRLCDVYPDGRSMLVCDGILRASFRDGFVTPVPIVPGEVYAYEVDLWSTAIVFAVGHRIRVSVGNSNSPRFGLNPVYATVGQAGAPGLGEMSVFTYADLPSRLLLPVTDPAPGEHPLLPLDTGILDWFWETF